jgi:putative ABC transport system permease protein
MFRNYFKTAIRSLIRNRTYSIINIAGLAAGIAVFLLIFVIICFESSYDGFHPNKDRIYRVVTEHHRLGLGVFYNQGVHFPLPATLRHDFPELVAISGIYGSHNDQVLIPGEHGEEPKKFKEASGVFNVEPTFFSIFKFPWIAGSPASLSDPQSAALTKETAERYFGDWRNAMGKTIMLNGHNTFKITGILGAIPANTDWWSVDQDHVCYILTPSGLTAASLEPRLRAFIKKYQSADNKDALALQPLRLVHIYDEHNGNFSGKTVQPEVVKAMWLIASLSCLSPV